MYCSWEMPGPGWSTLHHHLHDVPGERSFSATRVLVVCSACQVLVFVNPRLSTGLPAGESLGAIGLSVIPGWTTPVVLLCQVTLQPSFLVFSSPSFPRVGSCFPTPFTFLHLAPLSPPFRFCPFTPVTRPSLFFLSLHTFLGFPLRVTSHFFLCRSIH